MSEEEKQAAAARESLNDAKERLRVSAEELKRVSSGVNQNEDGFDCAALARVCTAALKIVDGEADDEFRDDLVTLYPSIPRPALEQESISYSALLIDKNVNDLRDAIADANVAAEKAGLPLNAQSNLMPPAIFVSRATYSSEIGQLTSKIATIEGDVASLRVTGNQIGLVNISVPKIEIKVTLANALARARPQVDATGLSRAFQGIRRLIEGTSSGLKAAKIMISDYIKDIINRVFTQAKESLFIVQGILENAAGDEDLFSKGDARIWTESEVKSLLLEGVNVPDEAIPYVKRLEFRPSERIASDAINRLTSIEHLELIGPANTGRVKLANFRKLRTLFLSTFDGSDLTALANLSDLEVLRVTGSHSPTKQITLPQILHLPRLKELSIGSCLLANVPDLTGCAALKELSFTSVRCPNWDNVGSATTIEDLSILGCDLERADFLPQLMQLTELDLRDTPIKSTGNLRSVTRLHKVRLSRRYANRISLWMFPSWMDIVGDYGGMIRRRWT